MDLLRTEVDTQVGRRVEALQKAGNSEELQNSGEMDGLMERTRDLWEHKEDCQTKIATLEAQNQELEDQRAKGVEERSKLRNQIRELTEERSDLVQQLENARAQPSPMVHRSPEITFMHSGGVDARIRQLQQVRPAQLRTRSVPASGD